MLSVCSWSCAICQLQVSGPAPTGPLDVLSAIWAWILPCFGWTIVIVLVILVATWLQRRVSKVLCNAILNSLGIFWSMEAKALRIKWPESVAKPVV